MGDRLTTEHFEAIDTDDVNLSYERFCDIVKRNMSNHLPSKRVRIDDCRRSHRHTPKPWWTTWLTELWDIRCIAYHLFCSNSTVDKHESREQFKVAQYTFDQAVKDAKRQYWLHQQRHLLTINQNSELWKSMGNVGIRTSSNKDIPWEVVHSDGSLSTLKAEVLEQWKSDFEQLLNSNDADPHLTSDINRQEIDTQSLNCETLSAHRGKALGDDGIPVEILNNRNCIVYLTRLFNTCLRSSTVPELWSRGIIKPILKNCNDDPRDPLNYRGITITSSVYKLYCSILNKRLANWFKIHGIICDEQNGFRAGRSTIDHTCSISYIVETRLKKKQDTHVAFIDFSMAYDRIDRKLLWHKLEQFGISGDFLKTLQALYADVKCSVRVNNTLTDWFNVSMGLKQGCILSPQLFNAFLNGLTQCINELHCGVEYGDNSISMLLYADDIILIANDEHKFQRMLDVLDEYCKTWRLTINPNKSKIVHFHRKSCPRSTQQFHCGNKAIEIVSSYKYLSLVLNEFLDFRITAKVVSQSASRALGLLISKDKAFGGMPYECFSKCYDALVQSIINYGAAVWGSTGYSCIAAVQNRPCRYFMGLGKYAPSPAIQGDMGWSLPEHRQWMCVIRQWCRMINMNV